MPKLSVIMSVYNGGKYLEESIESVLNQTFKDFEFIIVNDGSTDNTKEILEKFSEKDKRIKIIENKENIGLTKSLNKCIKLSKGEFIARMDADDISCSERFEKQVKLLDISNAGVISCNTLLIDKKGNLLRKIKLPKRIKSVLKKRNCLIHGSLMFNKKILKNLNGYNERMILAQDYELLLRLSHKFKIGFVQEFLYKHRVHKKNISRVRLYQQMYYTALAKKLGNNSKLPLFFYLAHTFFYNYRCGLTLILRIIK